jgi:hypothetical protein
MVALIGAGCANAPAQNGTKHATHRDKAMKFAKCMRDHGVSAFPDPDASGELTIDGIVNRSSLDPSAPAWKQAIRACKNLQPPGFTGHKRSAEQQRAALKFAACMRENGVEDFPDPTADAPLIDTNRIPSAAGRGALSIPGFQAAVQRCGDVLAGALERR